MADDVRWTTYTYEDIVRHASYGLSSLWTWDNEFWLTRMVIVFDIFVEDYAMH